jgi:Flp pilus assembly protein TadD
VESAKAKLLEAQGELEEAHPLRKEVAQRRPTWRNILDLATLEFRLGKSGIGRQRLQALLAEQPHNQTVREHQAFLEASYGDLELAAAIYEDLIRARPARSYLTNLAFVRYLLGDYAAAAAANRKALALEPDQLLTRFNLATALEAQDDRAAARRLYQTLEKELAATSTPLDGRTRMLQAQCLVRLGRRDEARRLADEVFEKRPEDVQGLHQAAQLYALLEDPVSARFYVKLAREKGVRREWFTTPEFHSLQSDSEFQSLLGARSPLSADQIEVAFRGNLTSWEPRGHRSSRRSARP